MFSAHAKPQTQRLFPRFEERFGKAPFLVRISVDEMPNLRNKATFSNLSGVVTHHFTQLTCDNTE